jgi:hypothetical protein
LELDGVYAEGILKVALKFEKSYKAGYLLILKEANNKRGNAISVGK